MGRPRAELKLTDADRSRLLSMAEGDDRVAGRARVVLACADGDAQVAAAEREGVHVETVRRVLGRYRASGPGGLVDGKRPGRAKKALVLAEHERDTLARWARRRNSSQALALRCRIVLAAADGVSNKAIAARLGVSEHTVSKWRSRFIERRLDGLLDEPRSGGPRTVSDDQVEDVIVRTLETTPPDATHWSTRSMADAVGLSNYTISRIWNAFGLKPHKVQEWKLSNDPQFIEKLRDVVGLYLDPPDAAVVFCVDEKSRTQALERSAPILPIMPHTPARMTHDYYRHGTTDLFAALDVATGRVLTDCRPSHTSNDFRNFLNKINRAVPDDLDVHIVLDNLRTHKTDKIERWNKRHPRFHFHFTPTYSSWLNLVERWFAALTTKLLQRSSHQSITELETDILAWADQWNENPHPYTWVKTADEILESIAAYLTPLTSTTNDTNT